MPLTSADIAAQIAAGQQAHMMQLQRADLISDALRRDPQFGAPDLAGRAINTVGAFGVPAVGLGMGMMGLDPFSLGMKGFGVGRALGMGMGASLGVGAGFYGVATAGGMAAAYAAQQIHMGMQQQQHFMRGMQQSYNFLTPQGMGFNNQQLGAIGWQIRQMSGQIGPLGQMVGFEELSSLAQNMGQMGMARGLQDVTQFTQNFRKMIESAKHVAREMGTSLREAQEMMSNMRNSGIFSNQGQMQMASEMRSTSLAGNLGMPELTQMAGIGSRVSRAVGGLGSHGAFAGVRTIGQIGMAMQVGALTDEDIYNTTGLRGAEGRQAMAASQLQGAAGWLRTGRGRRFLASMAGSDGNLDEGMVRAWQAGDMGIPNTMGSRMESRGVDRANFIRNEGRLRGSALAAFGGNIPAMALSQWASSRNIDIQDMDDRSMVFAQRQLGMSRDEVDSAVKILQSMPQQMAEARRSAMTDQYRTDVAAHRRTSGLEGVKRKVEAHREHVQNYLQGKGQEIYSGLVNDIENWIDKKMGAVVNQATKDVDQVYASAMEGRGGGRADVMLGTGLSGSGLQKLVGSLGSRSEMKGISAEMLTKGGMLGVSMADKLTASGYSSEVERWKSGDTSAQKDILGALRGARLGNDKDAMDWAGKNKDYLGMLYSTGGLQDIKGSDRARELAKRLERLGFDQQAVAIRKKLLEGSLEDRMNTVASLEKGLGVAESAGIAANSGLAGGLESILGGSGGMRSDHDRTKDYSVVGSRVTDEERQAREAHIAMARAPAWKRALQGATGYREGNTLSNNLKGMAARTAFNLLFGGTAFMTGAIRGLLTEEADAHASHGRGGGANKFQGQFLTTEEGLSLSRDILTGADRTKELESKVRTSAKDSEERDFYVRAVRLNRLTKEARSSGKAIDWTKQDDDIRMTAEKMQVSYLEQTDINRRQAVGRDAAVAQKQVDSLRNVGMIDASGNLTGGAEERLAKMGVKKGSAAYDLLNMGNRVLVGRSNLTADRASVENVEEGIARGRTLADTIDSTSAADLQTAARARRSMGDYDGAAYLQQQADQKRRIERYSQRGAGVGTAMALGIKLDRKEANELAGMSQGDARLGAFLAHKLGIGGKDVSDYESKMAQLTQDNLNNKITTEEYEKRVAALKEGSREAIQESNVLEKLGTGKDAVNEKGISEQERQKRLSALVNSDDYKAVKKKKDEERQQSDPSLKHLSEIAKTLGEIKSSFTSLPGEIAKATKSDGQAPNPGGK